VTCVDVGLGELPATGEALGAGELLLPDDGDLDELGDGLGLAWCCHQSQGCDALVLPW